MTLAFVVWRVASLNLFVNCYCFFPTVMHQKRNTMKSRQAAMKQIISPPVNWTITQQVILNTSQPVMSNTSQPVTSSTHQPVTSSTDQPVTSSTHQPVTSSTHLPVMSNTSQPLMSSTLQAVTSCTHQPVMLNTTVPVTAGTSVTLTPNTSLFTSCRTRRMNVSSLQRWGHRNIFILLANVWYKCTPPPPQRVCKKKQDTNVFFLYSRYDTGPVSSGCGWSTHSPALSSTAHLVSRRFYSCCLLLFPGIFPEDFWATVLLSQQSIHQGLSTLVLRVNTRQFWPSMDADAVQWTKYQKTVLAVVQTLYRNSAEHVIMQFEW